MLYKLAILAISALAIAQPSGFASSCNSCLILGDNSVPNPSLSCYCDDGHGSHPFTSINLNDCFTNNHGYVQYQYGGYFGASCQVDDVGGHIMHANCNNGLGGNGDNHIDLNDHIANWGGTLAC